MAAAAPALQLKSVARSYGSGAARLDAASNIKDDLEEARRFREQAAAEVAALEGGQDGQQAAPGSGLPVLRRLCGGGCPLNQGARPPARRSGF